MPSPARTCSREVLGSATPFFAKTYFVKPEQSKPFGVLPPQTYFTPTYWSAVLLACAVAALADGERGMRTVVDPPDEPLPRELALITRPARTMPSRMVPGETASVPCAQAERTSMAEGTTAMGRTRMHGMCCWATAWMADERTTNSSAQGSFGATCRVRRKPSSGNVLCIPMRTSRVRVVRFG